MYNFEGINTFNKNYNAKKVQETYKRLRNHLKKARSKQQVYNSLKNISHDLNNLNRSGLEFLGGEVNDTNVLNDDSIVKTLNHTNIKKILRQTIPPTRSKQQMLHNINNLFHIFDYWMDDNDFNKGVDFDLEDVENDNVVADNINNVVGENQNISPEMQHVANDLILDEKKENLYVENDKNIGQELHYVENDNFNVHDFERVYRYNEGDSDDMSDIEIFAQNYINKIYS